VPGVVGFCRLSRCPACYSATLAGVWVPHRVQLGHLSAAGMLVWLHVSFCCSSVI
jgi:hypothetical protein